jgi:hypothetical protein
VRNRMRYAVLHLLEEGEVEGVEAAEVDGVHGFEFEALRVEVHR